MDTQSITPPHPLARMKGLRTPLEGAAQFYLRAASLAVLAVWLLYNAIRTVGRIIDFYTPLPIWDYWRVVLNLNAYRSFHWGVFWIQHNDHRIIFPELVFAADMLWFHGRLVLPLVASFLCYVAAWIALSSVVLADKRLGGFERSVAFLISGVVVLWEGSVNVLAAPFLLQWTMMQAAAACSFVFLTRINSSKSRWPLVGTVAAGTVATYSSGNALVLWPLLLSAAFFLRLKKNQKIVLTVSAAVDLGLFFVNYRTGGTLNLRNFFLHPLASLGFLASYISMPFGGMGTPAFGVAIGLFSLIGTALFFAVAVRKRLGFLPPAVVLLGYYVFTLLTALITAAGRMNPADEQFGGAKASRYVTVPQMGWGVFVLFCLWVAWSAPWRKQIGHLVAVVFVLFFSFYLPKLDRWLSVNADSFAAEQLAILSVENGLRDRNLLFYIYPDLPTIAAGLPVLQQSKLSIYSHPRASWLGKPIRQLASIRDFMPGAITEVTPVESGLQVTGWADTSQWKSPSRGVMLTDEAGKIVGFGSYIPAGFPRLAYSLTNPAPLGWAAFIPQKLQPAAISAYVLDNRKKNLFPLLSSVSAPPIRIVSSADLGAPIPSVEWKSDVGGTRGSVPLHINSRLISTPIESSWAGSDSYTGTLASSAFPAPADGCLVLPVIHGPVGDRVSVLIQNVETGKAIVDLTLHSPDQQQWTFWRVQVQPATKISVTAQDKGNGWGEWLAVASPSACR